MKSKVNSNLIINVYIITTILVWIIIFVLGHYLIKYLIKLIKNKKEHFSVVFYGDKPKEIEIPAKYPKYQRGPCLRKDKRGLVSWGNLTGDDPGNCDYQSELDQQKQPQKKQPKTKITVSKPNSLLDAQGNLKKGKINQLLGITNTTPIPNSFCTTSTNMESLNNQCQTRYPNLTPTVGVKEINKGACLSGGDQVVCDSGYFMGNQLSTTDAQVVGCNPISSNFNTHCQNQHGRRVGYKQLHRDGCKPGYQWAECSSLYYNGAPLYDRYINGEQMKATKCFPDNNINNFTESCQQFGPSWKVSSFVTDYCKPGTLRALCSNNSTSLPSTRGNNENGNSSSGTGPNLPNSCPCAH